MRNIHRNKNVLRLIDKSTETLAGWDERRGNYVEKHVMKPELVANVVEECIDVLSKNGNDYDALRRHFELK